MKVSWLVPSLLAGGGAAIGTVSDKVLNSEGRVLANGIPDQRHDRDLEGAALQSPSANTVAVNLDALDIALPNRTKAQLAVQARDASELGQHPDEGEPPVITFRTSNGALSGAEGDPAVRPPSSASSASSASLDSDHDLEFDEDSASASNGAGKAGNPASANRAIAGMSVGLVSVMLIFTIFL
ncbi:hypothetical protein MYCTH_2312275 [Thermothelomyces thermophilus ATCC 42464]|uniref:Uncharacterized protein n=1 Tax=Thermothelomyces thermophilus (strain ATCC 42464 / BCRC 31852 / DSM 1799) TaxID=573729 RepID=G2QQ90_THET4|nr:uncharacterized protein MYCTH_2312275 [Thermothelomyces thermophilus ATCC 42464]AEO61753.1 hypothetical protein MYCTH_2312275 [Thermothelomyces thermophilus ATCC 42464]